ncbi:MAG: CorA family divalent cation transporter [Planctomycetota bacterium]
MAKTPSKTKPPVAEPLLPKAWGVPREFRDRLGDDVGRQRVMQSEGHLLLVLHAPPVAGQKLRFGKIFWRNPEGAWKPVAMAHNDHPVGELLDQYEEVIEALDQRESDAHLARTYFEILTALNPLLRSCHNLYTVLHEARKAAKEDRELILLRDRAYALNRRAELLQQDAKNTLDFVIARRSEEQAESARRQAKAAHRLNILAALFFPLATIASVFSMGLHHGQEEFLTNNAPWPMLGVVAVGLTLGALLAVFVTRK